MPTFANTSETTFAFVPETTLGTTPTSPSFQKLRITSEGLDYNINNTTSNEIRPDADISDLIQVGANVTGDFSFELSYGSEFDTIFEHALRGAFASSRLDAGTDKKSLTFEKTFEVGSPDEYFRFEGCRVGQLSMSVQANSVITGTVSVNGLSSSNTTSELSGATYTDGNTNDVMAAPDAANITVGSTSGTLYFTDLSFQVNNNLRQQNAIGSLAAVGIGYGIREVTGSMTAYFDATSGQMYDDFVAGTEASLSFELSDGTNTYTVNFPRIKYQSGRVVAGGNNQDVLVEMQFQALYDSTEQTSIYLNN
jgi:hypothetical protein